MMSITKLAEKRVMNNTAVNVGDRSDFGVVTEDMAAYPEDTRPVL
jgi:hypothetical protein